MTTTTISSDWWRTAPNPPCAPFCDRTHGQDEFSVGGGLLCLHGTLLIEEPNLWVVEVQQYVGLTEDQRRYERRPAEVNVDHHGEDILSVEQTLMVASALIEAARIAMETNMGGGA